MTAAFDDRLIKVVFTYGNTSVTYDQSYYIRAQGRKYANPQQDECTIVIANIAKSVRDQLATQLTPFNYDQQRKSVKVYGGRKSTGLFLLFEGDITGTNPSQPPDIFLTVKASTCQFYKYDLISQAANVSAPLSSIAGNVASSMGLNLRFEATDKSIGNYSYSGPVVRQVESLRSLSNIDAYVDGNTLVCKDRGTALKNVTHVLSQDTGMIGKPDPTEYGVHATSFLAPTAVIGGGLTLQSKLNPLLNGDYTIYQLGFDIASRETPFYSIYDASKYPVLFGAASLPQVPSQ